MDLITLRASVPFSSSFEPAAVWVRSLRDEDRHALARLYFEAYDPGVACDTIEEALEDIDATFRGDYGELWGDASPVAVVDDVIIGAVLTVRRAPWDDVPDEPFVIEVFTGREFRRRRVAQTLISEAMATVAATGEDGLALRVAADNAAALDLYRKLGFDVVD